jgi:hypothetical protein
MMLKSLVPIVLSLFAGGPVFAQTVRAPVAPAPLATAEADTMKLQATMMAAQQAAIKPGDEALPCEALHKELVTTMTDPAIQSYAARTNAAYAREVAAQTKPMTPEAAAALAAALVPAAGMTGMAPLPQVMPGQATTPQQMQAMLLAQQQASIAYMNQLAPIMPALMRSQRVTMLAAVKNCTWATSGLGVYPGVPAPGSLPAGAVAPRVR